MNQDELEKSCAKFEKRDPKKLTLGEKFLCTIVSPFMFNLTKWETDGKTKPPSYFKVLKDIWTNKI